MMEVVYLLQSEEKTKKNKKLIINQITAMEQSSVGRCNQTKTISIKTGYQGRKIY